MLFYVHTLLSYFLLFPHTFFPSSFDVFEGKCNTVNMHADVGVGVGAEKMERNIQKWE